MISTSSNSLSAYHDISRLDALKYKAINNPEDSVMEVAKQFESIFLNMMLSSARETLQDGGLFNSSELKSYQQMFDQQASIDISERGGIGLAEIIARQLRFSTGGSDSSDAVTQNAEPTLSDKPTLNDKPTDKIDVDSSMKTGRLY